MHIPLPSTPASIGRARVFVRDTAGGLGPGLVEDAVLLTSELVTNAVRHGGANIALSTESGPDYLVVSVHDDGGRFLVGDLVAPPPHVASGRGLQMVHRVAGRWGVRNDDDPDGGKTVWFCLGSGCDANLPPSTTPDTSKEEDEGWNS